MQNSAEPLSNQQIGPAPPPPRAFPSLQYGIPVTKYDRKGFKARQRQLILTQKAAYVVELAKIKQKIEYSALKGETQATSGPVPGRLGSRHPRQEALDGRAAL